MKKIIALTALIYFGLLLGLGLNKANAAYSNSGSVSVGSTFTVVVLPALEQTTFSDQTWLDGQEINRQIDLGVRANFNGWALDYQLVNNPNRIYPAQCQSYGNIGNRNLDNSFQTIGLSCSQKISYGDSTNWPAIDVIYQVKSAL